MVVFIDNWQFLYFVLLQYLCSCRKVGLLMRCYKVFACHHLVDGLVEAAFEAQVAVCNNTNQVVVFINNRNTTDMVFCHHCQSFSYGFSSTNGNRVVNHTILGTLHDSNLSCLLLDGHILVYHTDSTLTCYGNSHRTFRYGVHRRCNERNVQFYVT